MVITNEGRIGPPAIAIAYQDGKDSAEVEANARLIAASPDLLKACELLVKAAGDAQHGWTMLGKAVELADAALAKARGEA